MTDQVCVDAFSHALQITFKVYDIIEFARNERLHENLDMTWKHTPDVNDCRQVNDYTVVITVDVKFRRTIDWSTCPTVDQVVVVVSGMQLCKIA